MTTCISATHEFSHPLPNDLASDDVRLSERVLHFLLKRYSSVGETVFDPFAGFGTTLIASERLSRVGYGVERDKNRWAYAQQFLNTPERFILGDIRALDFSALPKFSLSISSPVFMHEVDDLDPLSGFAEAGSYREYISSLIEIYALVKAHTAPNRHIIVEAANLKREDRTTMFAWDLAQALRSILHFEGELILDWGELGYGYGYTHSYCLVFRA